MVLAADVWTGQLAVVLEDADFAAPGAPLSLSVTYLGEGGEDSIGGSSSSKARTERLRLRSGETTAQELQRRGLAPLATPPTDEHLQAAVAAALWNGEQSWGVYLVTAARAVFLYQRGVDYLVRDAKVCAWAVWGWR